MILTGGLGYGGGIAARGFGAWIGGVVVPPVVLPVPTAYGTRSRDGGRRRRIYPRLPDELLPDVLPPLVPPAGPHGNAPVLRTRAAREKEFFMLNLI